MTDSAESVGQESTAECGNGAVLMPKCGEIISPVVTAERQAFRRQLLLAVYDWENARFRCMRGAIESSCLLCRLTPVPFHLIRLLVQGRIGNPGTVPGDTYSLEAELAALVRLGELDRVLPEVIRAAQHAREHGLQEASRVFGPLGDLKDLPVVDFTPLFNSSAHSSPVCGGSAGHRWRFDDGCDIGFTDYYPPDQDGFTRHFQVYSRTILVPARNADGEPIRTRDGFKRVPGPDGWKTYFQRPTKEDLFVVTSQGLRTLEQVELTERADSKALDQCIAATPSEHHSLGRTASPAGMEAASQEPVADSPASAGREMTLSEAASFYADLTRTKPDKGNTSRRLCDEDGNFTIEHIALKARAANRKKGKSKQRKLMSESDLPQTCSKCGIVVCPPKALWGSGNLCEDCMYVPRCN